jgi:hypothetical protein
VFTTSTDACHLVGILMGQHERRELTNSESCTKNETVSHLTYIPF